MSLTRFTTERELAAFLGKLDPQYDQYASELWQKGIKTPRQLANFSEPHYRRCGVLEGHIDDIKASSLPARHHSAGPAYQHGSFPASGHSSAAQQPVHCLAPRQGSQQQQQQYSAVACAHPHVHVDGVAAMAKQVPALPLPQLATPGAVHPPDVQAAGTASASSGHGFTQSQLNVLRNQVLAFRRFKVSIAALHLDKIVHCSAKGMVFMQSG